MSFNATLYHGLFHRHADSDRPRLSRHEAAPAAIPCPKTGRPLRIATIDANTLAICPSCAVHGLGGFVSFVGDLRMAYAAPSAGSSCGCGASDRMRSADERRAAPCR